MDKILKGKKFKILILGLFILYLAVLIYVILLKSGMALHMWNLRGSELSFAERISAINFIPFKTILYYLLGNESFISARNNILGNIFAFSPLGFLLPVLLDKCKKEKKVFFVGLAVSLSIEVIQVVFRLGSGDIDDLILNVFGTIIGFWIYKVLVTLLRERKQ